MDSQQLIELSEWLQKKKIGFSMDSQQQLIELRESLQGLGNEMLLFLGNHLLISKEDKDSNIVFSPLSVQVVLSLIAAGTNGETLEQLLSLFKAETMDQLNSISSHLINFVFADGSSSGGPHLSSANAMWIDKSMSLNPCFKLVAHNFYKAIADQVDFQNQAEAARTLVNEWVGEKTRGLIKDIISPGVFHNLTRLAIANAIYFKGLWEEKFDVSKTKNYKFHLVDGHSIQVPFMTNWNDQYIRVFDGFKVLRLPYKQGRDIRQFSMCIFLPDAKNGLPALTHKVCSQSGFLDSHIPYWKVQVGEFRIPKFKFEFEFEVSDALKEAGIGLPCLSEIVVEPVEPLIVSNIIHKALIEVNEDGTEAAAATVGCIVQSTSCHRPKMIDFVADHPFLFLVREDNTRLVLFAGHVLNP